MCKTVHFILFYYFGSFMLCFSFIPIFFTKSMFIFVHKLNVCDCFYYTVFIFICGHMIKITKSMFVSTFLFISISIFLMLFTVFWWQMLLTIFIYVYKRVYLYVLCMQFKILNTFSVQSNKIHIAQIHTNSNSNQHLQLFLLASSSYFLLQLFYICIVVFENFYSTTFTHTGQRRIIKENTLLILGRKKKTHQIYYYDKIKSKCVGISTQSYQIVN